MLINDNGITREMTEEEIQLYYDVNIECPVENNEK